MTPMPITTGPVTDLPGPVAAAVVVTLAILGAGAPLGVLAPHPERRARRRADRALLHLAHRKEPTVQADHLARLAVEDDPRRSPDWCWTHGCHRSQCPQPQPGQGGGH